LALITAIGWKAGEPERVRSFPAAALWLALCIALSLLAGCAGTPRSVPSGAAGAAAQTMAPKARTVPFLWRARGPEDGDGLIHLFGSIHVGRPEFLNFPTPVTAAYDNAEELAVEVDISGLSDHEITKKALRFVLLPEGEMLRDRISAETYAALAESGMPMKAMDRMKPWAISTIIEMSQFTAAGLKEEYGVDKHFISKASGARPIRGLETLESQAATFDGLSWEIQELMLADSLDRIGEDPTEIVDSWVSGDEAALTRLLFEPLELEPRYGPFYDAVFFVRNEAMAEQLAALSRDGKKRFVVVGVGHLLGPRAIPALLAERGFRIERVPSP